MNRPWHIFERIQAIPVFIYKPSEPPLSISWISNKLSIENTEVGDSKEGSVNVSSSKSDVRDIVHVPIPLMTKQEAKKIFSALRQLKQREREQEDNISKREAKDITSPEANRNHEIIQSNGIDDQEWSQLLARAPWVNLSLFHTTMEQ